MQPKDYFYLQLEDEIMELVVQVLLTIQENTVTTGLQSQLLLVQDITCILMEV